MGAKVFVNRSSHSGMQWGVSYTAEAIGRVTGIHKNTLRARLKDKDELTDHELRDVIVTRPRAKRRRSCDMFLRLETDADRLSQKYLRGKLI
jgi:hypothetical protein